MAQETYSYNFLQNNGFTFLLERIPQTIFRVTSCDVPGLTVPTPETSSGRTTQYFPGTANEFDELVMEFIVDENLKNYEELYRWITQQRYTDKEFVPKSEKENLLVSDGVLVTMTNASNPNRVFKFANMFPISLGNIHFDTTISEPQPVTCTVTFKYSYFELVPKALD